MNAFSIIETCGARGIELKADGEYLRFRPLDLDADTLAVLKAHKAELLAALAPTPVRWRVDERGRVAFPDGSIYARTEGGGWILIQHPTKRMAAPGTVEVNR